MKKPVAKIDLPPVDLKELAALWTAGLESLRRACRKWDGRGAKHPWPSAWDAGLRAVVARGKLLYDSAYAAPEADEVAWFWTACEDVPFLRMWCGAFKIKPKKRMGGLIRFFPNEEQDILCRHAMALWVAGFEIDQIILKCRQDGISTYGCGALCCLVLISPASSSDVIPYEASTGVDLLRRQKRMLNNMPEWDRPALGRDGGARDNDDETTIEDPLRVTDRCPEGLTDVAMECDSAEKREKIGRGRTYNFVHYTEIPFWRDAVGVYSAMEETIANGPGTFKLHESTGQVLTDLFAAMYKEGRSSPEVGQAAFFFSWFMHRDYRTALPRGVTPEEFLESLPGQLREKYKLYGCDIEQSNWHFLKWKKAKQKGPEALAELLREHPFNEDEAFQGATKGVFDGECLASANVLAGNLKPGTIASVAELGTSTPMDKTRIRRVALVKLIHDHVHKYEGCRFEDDEFAGLWSMVEAPPKHGGREAQVHGVVVDLAEGKLDMRGRGTGDNTAIRVVRATRDPNTDTMQYCDVCWFTGPMDVVEAARCAMALSILYPGIGGENATVMFERNFEGRAFIEAGEADGMKFYEGETVGEAQVKGLRNYGIRASTGTEGEETKVALVADFRDAFHNGLIRINDTQVVEEMRHFGKDEKGRYKGLGNKKDDRVTTWYLAIRLIKWMYRMFVLSAPIPAEEPDRIRVAEELQEKKARLSEVDLEKLVLKRLGIAVPGETKRGRFFDHA